MKWRLQIYGFLIGFGMLVASLAFYWNINQETSKKVSGQLSRDANILAVQLHSRLDHLNLTSIQLLKAISDKVQHLNSQSTKLLYADYPEVEAVYFADQNKISLLFPKSFDDRLISNLLSENAMLEKDSNQTKLRYANHIGQSYWALFTKMPSSKSQKLIVLTPTKKNSPSRIVRDLGGDEFFSLFFHMDVENGTWMITRILFVSRDGKDLTQNSDKKVFTMSSFFS